MKINEIDTDLQPGEKRQFEPSNTDASRSWDKFVSDCSESIKAMQTANKLLYRGVRNKANMPEIFVGSSRKDRKPLDSGQKMQGVFDQVLADKGFIALRSNSIFCTSMYEFAVGYGPVYAIFPVNGFKFTWSSEVDDLTEFMYNRNIEFTHEMTSYMQTHPDFVRSYKQDNLVSALYSENEIFINGQYYAFRNRIVGDGIVSKIKQRLNIGS